MYIGPILRLLVSFLLSLPMCLVCRSAQAEPKERVRVLQATEMDWPEGRRGVEDELLASGYLLSHASSDVVDVGVLLAMLEKQDSDDAVVAQVTVLRLGRTGMAYVWLPESNKTYRVTSGEPDPTRAANVLSLRVGELINLRGQGQAAEPVLPETQHKSESVPEKDSKTDERNQEWQLLVGAGISAGSGLGAPLATGEFSVGRQLFGLFGLEGAVSLGLNRPSRPFDTGDLRVGHQRATLGVFLGAGESLWWQAGASVGLGCYQFSWAGTPSTVPGSESECVGTSSAFARTGMRWRHAMLWLSGAVSLGHRAVRVLEDESVLAVYGRPMATFGGGIGWRF